MSSMGFDYYPERQMVEAAATEEFYQGLAELAQMPELTANFGWCLAQLADQPDHEEQFRGMVAFLEAVQQNGLTKTLNAIDYSQGVPVRASRLDFGDDSGTVEGRLLGLTSSERVRGRFQGIACVDTNNVSVRFAPVLIDIAYPGRVILLEDQTTQARRLSFFRRFKIFH